MRPIDADLLDKKMSDYCAGECDICIFNKSNEEEFHCGLFLQAPTIEALTWIPIETREPNSEEREAILKIYGEPDADDIPMFCGPMPDDGQEILISTIYGGVYFDICSIDCEEGLNIFALENGGDWEGVTAWMPMPKPYMRGNV